MAARVVRMMGHLIVGVGGTLYWLKAVDFMDYESLGTINPISIIYEPPIAQILVDYGLKLKNGVGTRKVR